MKLNVPDMSCGHCKASVEEAIRRLDPAATVDVDLGARTVTVTGSPDDAAVLNALDEIGFPATPV